jgi:hypothetical protein
MPLTTVSQGLLSTDAQYTGFKNRIINGDMTISQRNGTSSVTGNDGIYGVDRFVTIASQSSRLTVQQNQGSVTPPTGFRTYLGYTSSSAYSVTSGDYFGVVQHIEGFNTADLMWGTANAQTVTLSFWVRSSLTGTFGGVFTNANGTRSYPYTYTISAANTWEYKTVTVAGDTTGTWVGATNGRGLSIYFSLGMGSTYSGTTGSWSGSNFYSATGAVSVVGTNGATWYVTGIQLEKGNTATSFDVLDYGTELQLCQRYYQQFGGEANYQFYGTGIAQATTASSVLIYHPVTMRAAPSFNSVSATSLQIFGTGGGAVSSLSLDTGATTCSAITAFRSGLTAANGYMLLNNNSTAPRLQFSAEL